MFENKSNEPGCNLEGRRVHFIAKSDPGIEFAEYDPIASAVVQRSQFRSCKVHFPKKEWCHCPYIATVHGNILGGSILHLITATCGFTRRILMHMEF
jgi:hypothetical protein